LKPAARKAGSHGHANLHLHNKHAVSVCNRWACAPRLLIMNFGCKCHQLPVSPKHFLFYPMLRNLFFVREVQCVFARSRASGTLSRWANTVIIAHTCFIDKMILPPEQNQNTCAWYCVCMCVCMCARACARVCIRA
jgi:hypothetical protein